MAFARRKNIKDAIKETEEKLESILEENKNDKLEKIEEIKEAVTEMTEPKEEVVEIKEEKRIKNGTWVVVSGRLFGNSLLEFPMESVRDYKAKIISSVDGAYQIDRGWVSSKSIKKD